MSARPVIRALLFVPLSFALYLCHVFGWGMLGALVFGYEAFNRREIRPVDWKHLAKAALRTAPLWAPLVHMLVWQGSNPDSETGGVSIDRKVASIALSLQDRVLFLDLAFMALASLPIIQAFRKNDFFFDTRVVRIFAPLFLAYLIIPNVVFGSAYADVRLAPYLVALLLLAIRPSVSAVAIACAGVVFFALRVLLVGYTAHVEERELQAYLPIFAELEHGSALYQINGHPCSETTIRSNRLLGAHHIRLNAGYSNATWDMGDSNPLKISRTIPKTYRVDPVAASGAWGCDARERDRPQYLYDHLPRNIFQYVLFVDRPEDVELRPQDVLVARARDAEIYRLARSRDADTNPH